MIKFEHDLKQPVQVAINGKMCDAVALTVYAPNAKVYNEVFVIDAEYAKAKKEAELDSVQLVKGMTTEQLNSFMNAGKKQKKSTEKEPEIKPSEIVAQMLKNNAKIDKCFEALKNILTAGTKEKPMCTIDNVKLEEIIFEQFGLEDLKEILGKYIESFLDTSRNALKTS